MGFVANTARTGERNLWVIIYMKEQLKGMELRGEKQGQALSMPLLLLTVFLMFYTIMIFLQVFEAMTVWCSSKVCSEKIYTVR